MVKKKVKKSKASLKLRTAARKNRTRNSVPSRKGTKVLSPSGKKK